MRSTEAESGVVRVRPPAHRQHRGRIAGKIFEFRLGIVDIERQVDRACADCRHVEDQRFDILFGLHKDALTVSGGAIWDEVKDAVNHNEDVILPVEMALAQQGGAVVVDGDGVVVYAHRSEYIADNADPGELVAAAMRVVGRRDAAALAGKGVV